jgi:16S rRNA (guanine966-N2)-methyltransferase
MSTLQHDLPAARVLDLFAGSGALGLEALSRGAAHVTFVENEAAALRALNANITKLGVTDKVEIAKADALRFVEAVEGMPYDIALADPPYDSDAAVLLATRFAAAPFARVLAVEHRAGVSLTDDVVRTRRYGDTALTFITAPE